MFCGRGVGGLHESRAAVEVINRSSFRQQAQSARHDDYMWAGMPNETHTTTFTRADDGTAPGTLVAPHGSKW